MKDKEQKPTVRDGTIAIPMPKRNDFARLVKKSAQPLGSRGSEKKRPK
jgi:hypothetical protein